MSKNQVVSLSLKIIGIYAMIQSIPWIGSIFHSFADFDKHNWAYTKFILIESLSVFSLLVLTGYFLIKISNKITQDCDSNDNEVLFSSDSINFPDLQELAFAITGVFIFINSIPSLFRFISEIIMFAMTDPFLKNKFPTNYITYGIGNLIQTSLGLWFFISSKGIITLWQKLRQRWDETSVLNSIHFSDLQKLVFAIAGIYIFINSIPALLWFIGEFIIFLATDASQRETFQMSIIASKIGTLIQATLGLWLFLGSKGIVTLLQKLRQRWNYERNRDIK